MDAVRALQIAIDKERLIRGEPTERSAIDIERKIRSEHERWILPEAGDCGTDPTIEAEMLGPAHREANDD
jgi:hypothetical protein